VPNPGNPLDWDRFSYVRNNPLRYVDPSGHELTCSLVLDDECVEKNTGQKTKRQTIDLSPYGKNVADLFDLFINTHGWWQQLISEGTDAFTLFYSIMLSRESQPLWTEAGSGWGSGGAGDAKTWFSRAVTHWLWGWTKDKYGISFGNLTSQGQQNVVFNLLGRWESVEGIMNAVLGRTKSGSDSQYRGSKEDNLRKVLQISMFNDETTSMAKRALRGPASGYWTWGNAYPPEEIPADAVYSYSNSFYILNRYK
jgi:hypothetical protein